MRRYKVLKEETSYEKLVSLLKQGTQETQKVIKKNKWGSDKYPPTLYKTTRDILNKEFPKMFTDKQINRALFTDRFTTVWDSAEYLKNIYNKKNK